MVVKTHRVVKNVQETDFNRRKWLKTRLQYNMKTNFISSTRREFLSNLAVQIRVHGTAGCLMKRTHLFRSCLLCLDAPHQLCISYIEMLEPPCASWNQLTRQLLLFARPIPTQIVRTEQKITRYRLLQTQQRFETFFVLL